MAERRDRLLRPSRTSRRQCLGISRHRSRRLWHTIINGELADNIVPLLDQLLWIIIIAELLFTVKVSFREHVLEPRPFLIVAVIAVSRRIIVLTAELSIAKRERASFPICALGARHPYGTRRRADRFAAFATAARA